MRILVTGATGNVGTAVVRALEADDRVDEIVGVARRLPDAPPPGKVRYEGGDVVSGNLVPLLRGADAVIHLAWAIQPSRDRATTRAVNVEGTANVLAAAAKAGVGTIVHASSVGAYSPHPQDDPVDEAFPTAGIPSSFYSVDKAACERLLDSFEAAHPGTRVVRLRPALIFQRTAAAEIRRFFLGPFFPGGIVRPGLIPVVPRIAGVRFQAVHADDVADAYRRAVLDPEARGAYNIASTPVLDLGAVAELLQARTVPVPFRAARMAADLTWRARVQPTPAGWLDLAAQAPLLDCGRALRELGWTPRRTSTETLEELMSGLRENAGDDTPPLAHDAGGPLRVNEVLSGVGARNPTSSGPRVSAPG
ncbi:MAG: NAD-dependent epimerase/dehydratase family protein [Solirubrobacterales bacterium]|nr:NAD-dependent epimerase/dehydratase family protein [Solirubrobacterales bacterium]